MFRRLQNMVVRRGSTIILAVATILVGLSLLVTNIIAEQLRIKEQHDVEVWAAAMERTNLDTTGNYTNDPLIQAIINNRNNIPFIITDENLRVISHHLIPDDIVQDEKKMRLELEKMQSENTPIVVQFWWTKHHNHIIFYGRSITLRTLYIFPYIQMFIIVVFMVIILVAFRSVKQSEQNRIWVGLAKETAHQLGTPTSSLLGWIEYLREQPVDQMAVDEMQKDLAHLMKIVDRFSKIGSESPLTTASLNNVVGSAVMYFRKRVPRNVTIEYNGLAINTINANINEALFEWVIENLLKNALDALQGRGVIDVKISCDEKYAYVDISDTGKGIPKSKWKSIFEPGYTTKTRGWGLGLSLSRRVIEEYHKGRISVLSSVIGRGTTFRIALKRV
ncbi:MAG: HAMP domain-containing histidine kinase [Alistipes sp.]|jgi:signal transduction histidine kinase|nr:HAMP domain-containing histidine kinase [Alistipes sp.]MBQ5836182.1 HAMP domain-containing histidine kinase [Alistipes sp.]